MLNLILIKFIVIIIAEKYFFLKSFPRDKVVGRNTDTSLNHQFVKNQIRLYKKV